MYIYTHCGVTRVLYSQIATFILFSFIRLPSSLSGRIKCHFQVLQEAVNSGLTHLCFFRGEWRKKCQSFTACSLCSHGASQVKPDFGQGRPERNNFLLPCFLSFCFFSPF